MKKRFRFCFQIDVDVSDEKYTRDPSLLEQELNHLRGNMATQCINDAWSNMELHEQWTEDDSL